MFMNFEEKQILINSCCMANFSYWLLPFSLDAIWSKFTQKKDHEVSHVMTMTPTLWKTFLNYDSTKDLSVKNIKWIWLSLSLTRLLVGKRVQELLALNFRTAPISYQIFRKSRILQKNNEALEWRTLPR